MKKFYSVLLAVVMLLSLMVGCDSTVTDQAAAESIPVEGMDQMKLPNVEAPPFVGTWEPYALVMDDKVYSFDQVDALADLYDTEYLIVDENAHFLFINNVYFNEGYVEQLENEDLYLLTVRETYRYEYADGEMEKVDCTSEEPSLYVVGLLDSLDEGFIFADCTMNNGSFTLGEMVFLYRETEGDDSYYVDYEATPKPTATPKPKFTNKYGTATTKCVKSGCSNYIASTGDTNCCVAHSNNCLNCGCYIDGDAMYCMSCITSAANNSSYSTPKPTQKPTLETNSEKCQYKDLYGNVCGARCTDYKSLCNKHFNELYSIYQDFTGG